MPASDPVVVAASAEYRLKQAEERIYWSESKLLKRVYIEFPERFTDADLGSWDTRPHGAALALERARKFVADPFCSPAPFLIGPSGTGKTWLLWAIAAALYERYREYLEGLGVKAIAKIRSGDLGAGLEADYVPTIRYESGATFAGKLRASVAADKVDKFITDLQDEGILFIDDLDVCKLSDFVAESLFRIVDHRYGTKSPTLVASNLSLTELAAVVGDRIVRRLVDGAAVTVIETPGAIRKIGVPEASSAPRKSLRLA